MKSFVYLASLFAITPLVAAHGWVDWVGIDGKVYQGNAPFGGGAPVDSPIRLVKDNSPVQLGTDPEDLPCGRGATNGATVVDAMPGSVYTVHWITESGQVWPHFMGPIMTYMASCGSTTCDKFDATNAKWFKIDQQSYMPDGKTWWQMNFHNNKTVDTTLPSNLAPGGYLIRHEIIALHNGETQNGAEFYPSCTQVKIGGSGSGTPDATVSFPGAYNADDKGILVNVYGMTAAYVFPGGPLSNLVNSNQDPGAGLATGSSGGGDAPAQTSAGGDDDTPASTSTAQATPTDGAGASSASSTPAVTGAASQSTSTGRCRMKRRSATPPSNAKRFLQHFTSSRRRHP